MPFKTAFSRWWIVATLLCCGALYIAYPNDHSLVPALLGVLVTSFFLYSAFIIIVAVGKNWIAAYRRNKR
jgi:hypothetical protein